jgi:hypothetical protein
MSISRDLRKLLVLGDFITVVENSDEYKSPRWTSVLQRLDKRCGHSEPKLSYDARLYSYQAWFSPSGQFVVILQPASSRSGKNIEGSICPRAWKLVALMESPHDGATNFNCGSNYTQSSYSA